MRGDEDIDLAGDIEVMRPAGEAGIELAELRKAGRFVSDYSENGTDAAHSWFVDGGVLDNGPFDLGVIPRLLNVCRRHKVAIWHGHDYKSNLLGLLLARFWPMKLLTTVHGWVHHTARTPLYYAVDRFCLPR